MYCTDMIYIYSLTAKIIAKSLYLSNYSTFCKFSLLAHTEKCTRYSDTTVQNKHHIHSSLPDFLLGLRF